VLCNSRTVVENEGSTKYYLVQRSSSRLLFVGLVGVFFGELLARDGAIWATMVCLAAYIMWVKLGLFPCHFWVVPVLQRVG
jgi:NADH:ubiquinone oxidoreductase subunit 2 (subunit N)